ncbi:CBS domain-containing protein [Rhodovibrionaceae bacterium A322]
MDRHIVPDIVTGQELMTLDPGCTVLEAVQHMARRKIGAVLVADNNRLCGIFTERDVVGRVLGQDMNPADTLLSQVMTPDPDTVKPDDTAMSALDKMGSKGYRHLPVVDGDKLVGIVSIRDLYASVRDQLEQDLKQRDQMIFDTGYGVG